jgi:hypothetical protein
MADLKAKRSSKLQLLKQELSRGFIEKDFEIAGHTFKLSTLSEDDETWADTYLRISTPAAMISSRKAPRLASAIRAIDGEPREVLFQFPDDMSPEMKKALSENAVQLRYWYNDQMLYFLLEDSNRPFINLLWEKYESLEKDREEAFKELPKS